MQIGQRNRRVALQHGTNTSDGQGGVTVAWVEYGRAWVNVAPLSGTEAVLAGQITGVLKTKVTMLYREDLLVKDRLILEGRTLEIDSFIDATGFRDELALVCSEVQA